MVIYEKCGTFDLYQIWMDPRTSLTQSGIAKVNEAIERVFAVRYLPGLFLATPTLSGRAVESAGFHC